MLVRDLRKILGVDRMADIWNEYPRPQMKRDNFFSLNGVWKLNGRDIVVPYPPQSRLSKYDGEIGDNLVYELNCIVPDLMNDKECLANGRVVLHFDAVDQKAEIVVNGNVVGTHEGGYLPFEFDITEVIRIGEINHFLVNVEDSLSPIYPYGKQRKNRGGMWYTPVSGIWKNVWIECVPQKYIREIKLTPDLEGVDIELCGDVDSFTAKISLQDGDFVEKKFLGKTGRFDLAKEMLMQGKKVKPICWSCENPHLYDMTIITDEDKIETYFALRTVEIKEVCGVNRVCLNGKPIFMHGVLDQGYYEDGIYLPKEEKEYERDIMRMKELGFNMLRKHIKVEPEIFYYYCDKHGMLVIQDMVNSGSYSFIRDTVLPTLGFKKVNDRKLPKRTKMKEELARRTFFEKHMREILQKLFNHPCIVVYTIFNEGWGQFESDRMYEVAKSLDSTRLYDSASGWFAQKKSDFDSRHVYFRTVRLKVKVRPLLLSECGGYTYKVSGHLYNLNKTYGYGKCNSLEDLTDKIVDMYEKMVIPAIESGLCGCVYTQLSDVEDEINGLYTFDRQVCKVDNIRLQKIAEKLFF